MVVTILKARKKTMQLELCNIFGKKFFKDTPVPTASAFYQNRNKMDSQLFKAILQKMNYDFYNSFKQEVKLYKNLRLLAIDSSVLTLPNTKVLKDKFGSTKNHNKESLAAGRLSCLCDVENKMVIYWPPLKGDQYIL